MGEATKQLIISALHNHLDPEAWILMYIEEGAVSMLTNIQTTEPANKVLAITMLDAILKSLREDEPGIMARLRPSLN